MITLGQTKNQTNQYRLIISLTTVIGDRGLVEILPTITTSL